MACGSTYAYMLVTESGLTTDEPWEWWPGPEDYDEWKDVVGNVQREVLRKWNYVLETEDTLAKMQEPPVDGAFPERDQLLFLLLEFTAKAEGVHGVMREWLTATDWTWEPGIRKAIAAGREGTCVLEMLDKAIAYYKRPPLPTADPPREPGTGKEKPDGPPPPSAGSSLVTAGILAGAVYYLWKKRRAKKA